MSLSFANLQDFLGNLPCNLVDVDEVRQGCSVDTCLPVVCQLIGLLIHFEGLVVHLKRWTARAIWVTVDCTCDSSVQTLIIRFASSAPELSAPSM